MKHIEKQLREEREKIRSIQAPHSLEQTIKEAISETKSQRKKASLIGLLAVALFFTIFIIYHYDAFTYYSKKIFGLENSEYYSFIHLQDQEFGQLINKSVELDDGTILTIDRVLADENQSLLFYTLTNEDGLPQDVHQSIMLGSMTGFLTNAYPMSSTGDFNDDMTELKVIQSYESIHPFSKNITLHLWENLLNGETVKREIRFQHDPNKSMQAHFNFSIEKSLPFDLGTIEIDTMVASPTMTKLEGTIETDKTTFEHLHDLSLDGIQLIANGNHLRTIQHRSQHTFTDIQIELFYGPLPENLHSLKLSLIDFIGYEAIDLTIDLDANLQKFVPLLGNEKILIKDINKTEKGTEVTVATDEKVVLDDVTLETENESIPFEEIVKEEDKLQKNAQFMKERVLLFSTSKQAHYLNVGGIYYQKKYDETVEIDLNALH